MVAPRRPYKYTHNPLVKLRNCSFMAVRVFTLFSFELDRDESSLYLVPVQIYPRSTLWSSRFADRVTVGVVDY